MVNIRVIKNKKKLAFVFLLIVALILIIFSVWLWVFRPLQREILDVNFMVGETLGVGFTGNGDLDFGRLVPGTSAKRNVIIENDYDFPIKIKVFASEDIIDYLSVGHEFYVEVNDSILIPVSVHAPGNIEFGNYSGRIEFRTIRT